jgi:hypothetical protein
MTAVRRGQRVELLSDGWPLSRGRGQRSRGLLTFVDGRTLLMVSSIVVLGSQNAGRFCWRLIVLRQPRLISGVSLWLLWLRLNLTLAVPALLLLPVQYAGDIAAVSAHVGSRTIVMPSAIG